MMLEDSKGESELERQMLRLIIIWPVDESNEKHLANL